VNKIAKFVGNKGCHSGTAIGMVVSLSLDQVDENKELLEKVAFAIHNQRRIVVVTGAGISVSAGIPDFRSADGLYARILSGSGSKTAKGKDFFDASFFHNSTTRPLFNRFVAELCKLCSSGSPTPTHSFIANLVKEGRVTRWYSQNIDGLEKAMGLQTTSCVDLHSTKKVPVVSLHGTLDRLICSACKTTTEFTDSHKVLFSEGDSPSCPSCELFSKERQASGRRAIKGGILRPDIVLYNEPHPQGDVIAEYVGFDISKRPTVLIVMGTSLKVVGLKKMIKDLARSVRQEPNGLVLFINKTPAPRSEWKTIFDFELIGECDAWVNILTGLPKAAPKKPLAVPITPKKDGRIDQIFKVVRKSTAEKAKSADPGNSENLVDNKVKPITRSASKTTTVL
jgi:NAD-dependent histone deacetylase SIR2